MKVTLLKLKNKIFEKQSDFQKIQVYNTDLGKSLFLDDIEQFSEFDEIEYHRTMAKVPILLHGNPKNILIIGGGDGGVARECLKYDSTVCIDQCEIDEEVVSVCRKYFPQMTCSFDDSKVNLIHEDAKDYVLSTNKKYDLILVDSTDPINKSVPLFKKDFYLNLKKLLNKGGVVSCQMQTPAVDFKVGSKVFSYLFETFSYLNFFFCTYHRERSTENTLFSVSSDKDIKIPKNLKNYFDLSSDEYKRVKNFLNKLNWMKR